MTEVGDPIDEAGPGEWVRRCREHKNHQGDRSERQQPFRNRGRVVDRGMTHARQAKDGGPEKPSRPMRNAEVHQQRHHQVGNDAMDARRKGIKDVSAIELAGG